MIRLRQPEVLLLGLWFGLMHDPLGVLRISLLCSLLHESGHIAAWVIFTGTLPVLELSPVERKLVLDLRTLTRDQRELILRNVAIMREQNEK